MKYHFDIASKWHKYRKQYTDTQNDTEIERKE